MSVAGVRRGIRGVPRASALQREQSLRDNEESYTEMSAPGERVIVVRCERPLAGVTTNHKQRSKNRIHQEQHQRGPVAGPRTASRGYMRLLHVVLVLAITSELHQVRPAGCSEEAANELAATTKADDDELHLLSTRLPRQQFRVGLGPTTRAALGSTFKLSKIQRRPVNASSGTKLMPAPSTQDEAASVVDLLTRSDRQQQAGISTSGGDLQRRQWNQNGRALPKGTGKKISSATLKKLLSQTLQQARASTTSTPQQASTVGPAASWPISAGRGPASPNKSSSNFKFVFIQRAKAEPPGGGGQNISAAQVPLVGGAKKPQRDSLAASVSRQLASSLLYSASSLISATNSSSVPSLSALAAALANSATSEQPSTRTKAPPLALDDGDQSRHQLASSKASSNQDKGNNDSNANDNDNDNQIIDKSLIGVSDIRRLSGAGPAAAAAGTARTQQGGTKTASSAAKTSKRPRPSKIYNLPVKFVANGQPSSVMFQSIKQHFATIKRLQAAAVAAVAAQNSKKTMGDYSHGGMMTLSSTQSNSKDPLSGSKRKKVSISGGHNRAKGPARLTGTNSRLIFLPLKYLSNAKPNKLSSVVRGGSSVTKGSVGAKASHKAALPENSD